MGKCTAGAPGLEVGGQGGAVFAALLADSASGETAEEDGPLRGSGAVLLWRPPPQYLSIIRELD